MLHRRLASLLVTATAAGLLATGCSSPATAFREQSAAVRVDDRTVSRSDFEDSLEFIADNDDFRNALRMGQDLLDGAGGDQGVFPQSLVGEVATFQVNAMIVAGTLEEQGLELSDNDRQTAVSDIAQVLPDGADGLPDSMRDGFVDYLAGLNRLVDELGEEEFNETMFAALEDANVSVNSRYGSWDRDEFVVVPPAGPASASG